MIVAVPHSAGAQGGTLTIGAGQFWMYFQAETPDVTQDYTADARDIASWGRLTDVAAWSRKRDIASMPQEADKEII